ncbi:hypothetical protein GDO86_003445 [Hymenochirus boettgeri]|uniref:Uncharacterized protein n=1 Tax=Hymenochirus boettgeri TaxID=247094 RepID=A0A8T2K5T6_9PIPI|nr:hypothetical protein GDO86_003445 [Hymenochirus boettgeri]
MWNNHGGFDGGYGGSGMGGGGGGYMQSPGGFGSPAPTQGEKKARSRAQQIVPCTVSQLLSATQNEEVFRIGEVELSQEASCESMVVPPGSYVKVSGHLRSFQNKKSVVAFKIASIEDMNEFVSHMLDVVHSHMSLNTQGVPVGGGSSLDHTTPGRIGTGDTGGSFCGGNDMQTNGLTPHQSQV